MSLLEKQSSGDKVVAGNVNPSDIIELKQDLTNIRNDIGDAYSSSKAYVVGDYFIHNNQLYRVKANCTNITPPNATYYDKTNVETELSDLKIKSFSVIRATDANNAITLTADETANRRILSVVGVQYNAQYPTGMLLVLGNGNVVIKVFNAYLQPIASGVEVRFLVYYN